jgi:hypothetical protein
MIKLMIVTDNWRRIKNCVIVPTTTWAFFGQPEEFRGIDKETQ